MTSLNLLVWRHYVRPQPPTVVPAKAKADIVRIQCQSLSLPFNNSIVLNHRPGTRLLKLKPFCFWVSNSPARPVSWWNLDIVIAACNCLQLYGIDFFQSIEWVKYRGPILRETSPALGSNDLKLDQSAMSIQILLEPKLVTWHVFCIKLRL